MFRFRALACAPLRNLLFPAYALIGICSTVTAQSAKPVEIQIKADQVSTHVSPALYGLMTEEINHAYDGGLYAELIQNRNFKQDLKQPLHWQLVEGHGGVGSMTLDPSVPFNSSTPVSLKLTIQSSVPGQRVGIANDGFWGIPVTPTTSYHASFYAKASPGFSGPIKLSIESNDTSKVASSAEVSHLSQSWQKYDLTLTTAQTAESASNHFVLSANHSGIIWFGMISLMPPTYNDRPNGNRPDIMHLLADLKPGFLRFPGGNYLEGNTIATRFDWKQTLGDISQRPGHADDAWNYWSSDGMGLLEFLEWCEDLHMQPLLAVYAGYSLKGEKAAAGPDLAPYVKDALDEIEYVTGDVSTPWGSQRVKDGHAAPFSLEYVEIGNEDNFDREPGGYDRRFAQFFEAIKAKYPQLKLIATAPAATRQADVIDEHYYRSSADEMAFHANDYDSRRRSSQKVFVGEWATRVGSPTPNMDAALADAAWLVGIERNSDLVVMSSYAPLFVNVNDGAMQWRTNLIGYDALSSYGSPTYYVQKMFSAHHGDIVLPLTASNIPTSEWQPPAVGQRVPMVQSVPQMFFDATRDSGTGLVYLKVVNRGGTPQSVHVVVTGVSSIDSRGQAITLVADDPSATNSIAEPTKILPGVSAVDGVGADFTKPFPPYSVTVLEIQAH